MPLFAFSFCTVILAGMPCQVAGRYAGLKSGLAACAHAGVGEGGVLVEGAGVGRRSSPGLLRFHFPLKSTCPRVCAGVSLGSLAVPVAQSHAHRAGGRCTKAGQEFRVGPRDLHLPKRPATTLAWCMDAAHAHVLGESVVIFPFFLLDHLSAAAGHYYQTQQAKQNRGRAGVDGRHQWRA